MNGKDQKFAEKTLKTDVLFEGKIITVQVDEVLLPDGRKATREIVKHSGAVAVIAIVDGKMLVVEQFRKPLERSLIEIPAGKLDPGEEPEQAAMRELEEETGYRCESVELIQSFYTAPGFSDEILHLYVAHKLEKGTLALDEDEFLQPSAITLDEAKRHIADGGIRDGKTIAAVYAWELYTLTGRFK